RMNLLKKSKVLASAVAMMLGVAMIAGCGGGDKKAEDTTKTAAIEGTVSASGSTALLPLLKPAQEEFQKLHDKVNINIAGGGSFTGMNQVAEGSVQVGNSDVNLPDDYKDKGLVDHKVVVEPFVFIANKELSVNNLTAAQVVDIMTGKVTNWKEVGGPDQAITIIHRAKSSGSRATIAEKVLKGAEFTDKAIIQDSNGAVRAAIANTPGAIGYVDAPYADQTVKTLDFDGVKYSPEAIISGKYTVWSYGHMYTKGEATGATKAFIDYVMSPEFQNTYVEKAGFIPVTKISK
ncbi:MAG: phosphate binding protein, partial [Massilibacillus sp.]|nr:phosphate binding protein [Massilibacillus sp.]